MEISGETGREQRVTRTVTVSTFASELSRILKQSKVDGSGERVMED